VKRGIRLRGISGPVKGQVWESDHLLRSGRIPSLEIMLDDNSVSRKHAEIRLSNDSSWAVTDLGSTNGTYVNGHRVPPDKPKTIKTRDIVQFGKIAFVVEMCDTATEGPPSDQMVLAARIAMSESQLHQQRTLFVPSVKPSVSPTVPASPSAVHRDSTRAGQQLMTLLRAGQHLIHLRSEDQLLETILNEAVNELDAQRGAIVLSTGTDADPKLELRSLAVGPREPSNRFAFSKRLVQRAYAAGESMLFKNLRDEAGSLTMSIADGAMGSVLCVMLRTPRRKLGVLHLDRSSMQSAFTEEDLMFADALAAHVSAGIECSILLRQQRDLFLKTITTLADMVELRDQYTGGHTRRVTQYAMMLGEKLELPDDQMELIRIGTPLHDIGKIGIEDAILRKTGRLTAKEFAEMQKHTTLGAHYLAGIPELSPIIPIVRNHHERWDGTGYPDRLAAEEIPQLARIVAVCDAFDAITSDRPYHENKKGRPAEVAFAEIARQMGRQFDPVSAAAFLEIRDNILRVKCELMPGSDVQHPIAKPLISDNAGKGSEITLSPSVNDSAVSDSLGDIDCGA
jgi:HD-GYP domain-containing protein (c-di-GMP phosphodiesterase class II)/pSer/pThr/pTyr-binding forkhead associated (FHA) protein